MGVRTPYSSRGFVAVQIHTSQPIYDWNLNHIIKWRAWRHVWTVSAAEWQSQTQRSDDEKQHELRRHLTTTTAVKLFTTDKVATTTVNILYSFTDETQLDCLVTLHMPYKTDVHDRIWRRDEQNRTQYSTLSTYSGVHVVIVVHAVMRHLTLT